MDGWVHMTYVTTQKILEWLSQLKDDKYNTTDFVSLVKMMMDEVRLENLAQKLGNDMTIHRAAYKTKQMKNNAETQSSNK